MGKKNSTSTSSVTVPPEVLARYNAVNARAETAGAAPFQGYGTQASDFVAQMNAQQGAGIADINATSGSYQPFIDTAKTATTAGMGPAYAGIQNYMSPYIQNVADTTGAMLRQANEQAQSGALGTAVSSGAFGGDRAGIAAANLANQQNMAYGKTMADIYNQGYTQALGASQADLARQLAGGSQMAGLGAQSQQLGLQGAQAKIAAGTMQQQTEQAGKDALINQFMQEKGYPFQVAQFLANIAMGTGAASGSTTTAVQPASFFSDRRLKEDVERIGEGDNGLPIYKYRYKGEPETHIGFMADEVEKVRPDAVGTHPTGYKTVDYDRATKAGGGGVAGPYGAIASPQPGLGSYVPEGYLPQYELMIADPSHLENARQSFAQQLEAAANLGNSVKDIEGNWQYWSNKWGSDPEKEAVAQGARSSGVAGHYASGGSAYTRPISADMGARSYLSDVLDAQSNQDNKSSGLQPPAQPPQARTTGQDIADIAKVAMAFFGMNRGGRTGYATRGEVEDETTGERVARLSYPLRQIVTERAPLTALATGSRALAFGQGLAGLAAGAADLPEASDYMFGASEGSINRANTFRDRAQAPFRAYPQRLSMGEISTLGQTPEQRAEIARRAGENMTPMPTAGDGLVPSREYLEYRKMMDRPTTATAPIPLPGGGGADRMPRSGQPMLSRSVGEGGGGADRMGRPLPSENIGLGGGGADRMGRPLPSENIGLGGGGADAGGIPVPLSYGLAPAGVVGSGTPLSYSPPADRGPAPLSYGLAPAGVGGSGTPLSYSPVAANAPAPAATGVVAPTAADTAAPQVTADGLTVVPVSDTTIGGLKPGQTAEPMGWNTLGPKIKARESGGDYDALYGFSHRDGGKFAGVKVTDMTIDQALEFADPSGEYGQWVARTRPDKEYGVATPLGAFQIVGSTLRGIKEGMGLTGNEKMTPALQEEMAKWLYQQEGAKPWRASEGMVQTTGGLMPAGGGAEEQFRAANRMEAPGGLKPYADRNVLGQMMYDPETNKLSRNALLSLASGIGATLSSPSQFLLPSLGLGLQGAAGTYAGLEKQAADIAQTQAQTLETQVRTDVSRFFTIGEGGMPMVVLGPNQTVTLSEYLKNPQMFSTGDPAVDARIEAEATRRAADVSGGAQPTTAAGAAVPTGVRWTTASQDAVTRANQAVMTPSGSMNFSVNSRGVNELANAATAESIAAISAKPNGNELSYVVGSSINDGTMGSLQGRNAVLRQILAPLNSVLRTAGINLETLDDPQTQAALLDKMSKLGAEGLMPDQQRAASVFNEFAALQPSLEMTPETAAAITASIMLSNQQAIDKANYYQAFQGSADAGFPPNYMTEGYADEYGRMHQIEKGNLNDLFLMAAPEIMDENGKMVPNEKAKTVKKFLEAANSGMLTEEEAQEVLNYILGQENTSQALARYFITGM